MAEFKAFQNDDLSTVSHSSWLLETTKHVGTKYSTSSRLSAQVDFFVSRNKEDLAKL
jgi:hypothetical protein